MKERTTPKPEYNQTKDLFLTEFSFSEDMIIKKFCYALLDLITTLVKKRQNPTSER